ncbi:MAG: DNA-3-methyladenine glycosylase [Clostridiales bacterium]|nr:DNA-3-methyladenine glycosylase [Clostridiales bacterium]
MAELEFLNKPSHIAAPRLLGYRLLKKAPSGELAGGTINEVEAYSEDDAASHCFGGKPTARTAPMFLRAGHVYVYFTYGLHHCFNIVTGPEGRGEGILIRSLIPEEGLDIMRENRKREKGLTDGPGKLCQALGITLEDRGKLLNQSDIMLLPPVMKVKSIKSTARIGIKKDTHRRWRFVGEF